MCTQGGPEKKTAKEVFKIVLMNPKRSYETCIDWSRVNNTKWCNTEPPTTTAPIDDAAGQAGASVHQQISAAGKYHTVIIFAGRYLGCVERGIRRGRGERVRHRQIHTGTYVWGAGENQYLFIYATNQDTGKHGHFIIKRLSAAFEMIG